MKKSGRVVILPLHTRQLLLLRQPYLFAEKFRRVPSATAVPQPEFLLLCPSCADKGDQTRGPRVTKSMQQDGNQHANVSVQVESRTRVDQ